MPKYEVTVERSAVEVMVFNIECHNPENAEKIALRCAESGPPYDKRVFAHKVDLSGDNESTWEAMEVEEQT
jgi:hypothetical protein